MDEKLSTRKIQILRGYFTVIIFHLLFFTHVETWPQKYTRKIWISLVEYSSAEVSDPSEVPRIDDNIFLVSQGSQDDLRALDGIGLLYTSDSLVRNIVFLTFFS